MHPYITRGCGMACQVLGEASTHILLINQLDYGMFLCLHTYEEMQPLKLLQAVCSDGLQYNQNLSQDLNYIAGTILLCLSAGGASTPSVQTVTHMA